jgi:colanic acid/amylovoran biosynthesis glycosyltransferase
MPGSLPFGLVKQVLDSSHIYVQPSVVTADGRREACGVAMLEAQALGLPVVATNIGGIPEAVADGRSGLLVDQKDPDALADRMIYLIKHPEVWHQMGLAGRRHVADNFDLNREIARLEGLYSSLIGESRRKPRRFAAW